MELYKLGFLIILNDIIVGRQIPCWYWFSCIILKYTKSLFQNILEVIQTGFLQLDF